MTVKLSSILIRNMYCMILKKRSKACKPLQNHRRRPFLVEGQGENPLRLFLLNWREKNSFRMEIIAWKGLPASEFGVLRIWTLNLKPRKQRRVGPSQSIPEWRSNLVVFFFIGRKTARIYGIIIVVLLVMKSPCLHQSTRSTLVRIENCCLLTHGIWTIENDYGSKRIDMDERRCVVP
jgi:hypothetical protein